MACILSYFNDKGPEWWSAIAAWLFGIAAITVQITVQARNTKRSAFVLGIETIKKLDDDFHGHLVDCRRIAAKALLKGVPHDKRDIDAVDEILDFFELVGYLYRKKIIDTEAAWHFFAYWLLPYFHCAQSAFSARKSVDENVFKDAEHLYLDVKKFEESHHSTSDSRHMLAPERIKEFLEEESRL